MAALATRRGLGTCRGLNPERLHLNSKQLCGWPYHSPLDSQQLSSQVSGTKGLL